MLARAVDTLLIAGLLIVLALPLLGRVLSLDAGSTLDEQRTLAAIPALPRTLADIGSFEKSFDAYWNDNFGFRSTLVRSYNRAMLWLGVAPTPRVLLGKEGWLFIGGGWAVDSYRATKSFTPGELAQWQRTLEQRRDWLAQQGVHYLFFVAPEKPTIYPEYMPDALSRVGSITRLDQLLDHLRRHSKVDVLDLRPALRAAKAQQRIYSLTDSHWNQVGALIASREVLSRLAIWFPNLRPLEVSEFEQSVVDMPGRDLAMILSLEDTLREQFLAVHPPHPRLAQKVDGPDPGQEGKCYETEVPDSTLPRALVFHDSFSEALKPFLSEDFAQITYCWQDYFDPAVVRRVHPDVVLEEMAERFLMKPVRKEFTEQ